jgi:ubiquinone/menaquinone biosynthesis C-methylase UbiE
LDVSLFLCSSVYLGPQSSGLNKRKQQEFFTHQYPSWLLKRPRLIHLVYVLNYLLQLRKWHIIGRLNKLLSSKNKPFYLLDAGCGEAQFLFPYAAQYCESYFKGIDRGHANIAFCNSYIKDRSLTHVSFEEMEMEQLKEKEIYDIVLCISVLPYSKNDRLALTCLHHAMKTGAELLLYVPVNQTIILPFYKKILQRYENYETIQQNQRVYTEQGLKLLLQDTDFKVVETKNTYGFFGKLSNELLNSHLILFNAYAFPFKIILSISLLISYPLILICMILDYTLPVRSGNGLMVLARK